MKDYLDVRLVNLEGSEVSLKEYLKGYTLLYFYPKDDTPGCTTEACSFRDINSEILALGVNIIGISKDSIKSHLKFKEKYKLNFELLSDPEHKLQEALGVWQEKSFMGRKYMGTQRMSFILDAKGKIIKKYEKVNPKTHAQEVLADLKLLLPK